MTVTAGWYEDYQDVLLMSFEDRFAWDEAYRAQDAINRTLDNGEYPCAMILRFPQETPNLTDALANARTLMARRHARIHLLVLVTPSPFIRALGRTFAQFLGPTGDRLDICTSLAEAETRLARAGYLRLKSTGSDAD